MKIFNQSFLAAGLLWAAAVIATPLPDTTDDNEVSAVNPCSVKPLKVNAQEIRGAHTHERVEVSSYRQCCEACYKRKGCALFTFVGEDDNYCRLSYNWEPGTGTVTKTCPSKITTAYEATDGADGRWWNMGAGPCGTAKACDGTCLSSSD